MTARETVPSVALVVSMGHRRRILRTAKVGQAMLAAWQELGSELCQVFQGWHMTWNQTAGGALIAIAHPSHWEVLTPKTLQLCGKRNALCIQLQRVTARSRTADQPMLSVGLTKIHATPSSF